MLTTEESELLSSYLDGELSGEEHARIQEKLTISLDWREALERLRGAKLLCNALPRVSAPLDLLDAIEAQALSVRQPSRWLAWFNPVVSPWRFAGSFAAAVFMLVVGQRMFLRPPEIPLDMLLAAHSRTSQASFLQDNIMAAADYSSLLKSHGNR